MAETSDPLTTGIPFASGDIVSGLEPGELVEIQAIRPFGSKQLVEAVGTDSGRLIRRPLNLDELGQLEKVRGQDCPFDGDAEMFLLGAEAHRIRIAYQFDPLLAVSSSIVDPLPHQVEAVYRYLLPLPRIRFLLADDTGAGKTIMAGLLLKELLFRGTIQKILVITPGGLTKQWQEDELQGKFGLSFRLVNRESFNAQPDQFARQDSGKFVVSIDFLARNEPCLQAARQTSWDFIVVDEAHKLSAYEYGNKLEESQRYQAVKALQDRTEHLLFLTATPHRGRKDTFRRLLQLLDVDLFQKDRHVTERIQDQAAAYNQALEDEESVEKARNRFFLRRLKEEMVDWDESPLFKERHTQTVGYDLTPEEKDLYDQVTRYVRTKRKEAKAKKNQNVALTLMVMQRRLTSSLHAITRTLENRLTALNDVLDLLNSADLSPSERRRLTESTTCASDPRDIAEYEGLTEEDREKIDERIFRQVLTADPQKIIEERDEVDRLHRLAEGLRHHEEAKFKELKKLLDDSDVMRDEEEKLLIFTEHKDTLWSLVDRLEQKGYSVTTIHGSMNVDERKEAQREFKTRAKIMVATDAAGEGINLQFCRYMINWDIPWNPNRLEQRMGRIHRYGQQDDVWVYNLVAQNTREGQVIQRVLKKLDVMREQMGEDRVFDVIDDWLQGVPLIDLIERAIESEGPEARAEMEKALAEASRERAEDLIDLQRKQSLASSLDLQSARELRDASDERRLQPLFIQHFFERAWAAAGGSMHEDEYYPVWHLGPVPSCVRDAGRAASKSLKDGYDIPFVFDKELVSVASDTRVPEGTKLLGPGHELFDALIEWSIQASRDTFARGTKLVDPSATAPEPIWLVRSTVVDARTEVRKRVAHDRLDVVSRDDEELTSMSPAYLLNCLPPDAERTMSAPPEETEEDIQIWTYENITEQQLQHAKTERLQECELRRDYLENAFTELIMDLQEQLIELQDESLLGTENREEQERLEERISELRERKAERLEELDLMEKLTADLPEVLGQAMVLPSPAATDVETPDEPTKGVPMQRDEEVEAIAMQKTMAYEHRRGWTPEDVSQDGEHFDVRSEGPNGEKRFIEVKGRAQSGAVILTGPELDKLRQLGERAWLYVVTRCRNKSPRLRIIQDPLSKLDPEELYKRVQYVVQQEQWSAYGEDVS